MTRPTDVAADRLEEAASDYRALAEVADSKLQRDYGERKARRCDAAANALREPPTVTEDMIERAARALRWEIGEGGGANAPITGKHLRIARTALTAALTPDQE